MDQEKEPKKDQYEDPALLDLEDLETVSGGGCGTGGSGQCNDAAQIAATDDE